MQGFQQLVRTAKTSRTALVLCHQNADPDAVCSAFLLTRLLKRLNRRMKITAASPDGVSKVSARVLERLRFRIEENVDPRNYDVIFTVDTNTLQQLGSLRETVDGCGKPLIMIDHHAIHPDTRHRATILLSNDKATSACEIVYRYCKATRTKLTKRDALATFLGLAYETGHFGIATTKSLKLACELLTRGVNGTEALNIIRMPMDNSERIARMKSAQRLRWESVEGWIVASTTVGSFHASVARSLVGLGAHLAIVAGEKEGKLTLSLRSTADFYANTGFHVGKDLATPLGEAMAGAGGGHATAAGATVQGTLDETIRKSVTLFKAHMEKRRTSS